MTPAAVRRRLSRLRARVAPRRRLRKLLGRPELSVLGDSAAPGSPADFEEWLGRVRGRAASGFPETWKVRRDLPVDAPVRVGVAMHVYFTELVPELLDELATLPVEFDLYMTNASGETLDLDVAALPRLCNLRVFDVDNHGRDILPLVQLVNAGLLDPYEIVLKVHTKKSVWREGHELTGTGEQWRRELLDGLLGSPGNVERILGAFATAPDLGMVSSDGSVLGPEFWGDNQAAAATLLRRIELGLDDQHLRFAAGSMYWCRGFVLQGLRALNLTAADFEPEGGQVNATTAHALERVLGLLVRESGQRVVEAGVLDAPDDPTAYTRYAAQAPREPNARVVPFYLPQFHPIEENNRWWGEGFTEWTNVARAQPVYHGHHQPKISTDMGFYDLRLDRIREQQADLARRHGLHGFMYYYYWFAGRRLLEKPIEALAAGGPDFPFSIMWANENWTRRWDGRSDDILIGQDYDRVPAEDFIDDVMDLLKDPRYMRVNGRCLLSVYRPGQMDNFPDVVEEWRRRAGEHGIELHVVSVDVAHEFDALSGSAADNGLDGLMGFPPHNHLWSWIPHEGLHVNPSFRGNLLSYQAMVKDAEARLRSGPEEQYFPGVMVTFDNTARRQWAGDVWFGANPYTFRRWLAQAVSAVSDRPADERVVFVNAWNEWAEGAVLEPNDRHGSTYLLAVRDVVHV
ncbi:glycoside hydrolase family 99-like domain-containing protein [Phycicoccus ginsengisoli]